jgi:hypothetical protein
VIHRRRLIDALLSTESSRTPVGTVSAFDSSSIVRNALPTPSQARAQSVVAIDEKGSSVLSNCKTRNAIASSSILLSPISQTPSPIPEWVWSIPIHTIRRDELFETAAPSMSRWERFARNSTYPNRRLDTGSVLLPGTKSHQWHLSQTLTV